MTYYSLSKQDIKYQKFIFSYLSTLEAASAKVCINCKTMPFAIKEKII
jgi:hypothetical protein